MLLFITLTTMRVILDKNTTKRSILNYNTLQQKHVMPNKKDAHYTLCLEKEAVSWVSEVDQLKQKNGEVTALKILKITQIDFVY